MRDMVNNTVSTHLGNLTLSGTTPAASAWVDMQGYDSCTIEMVNNTITDAGTAAGYTATMQHGDDTTAAGAAAVATTDTVNGTITVAETSDTNDDNVAGAIGYRGSKRYVRFNVTNDWRHGLPNTIKSDYIRYRSRRGGDICLRTAT